MSQTQKPAAVKVVKNENMMGGAPVIEGTRIRISDIVVKYKNPEYGIADILEAYPSLNRASVHAALSYYYLHKNEIDEEIHNNLKKDKELEERLPP